jgi:hypothetical protein
VPSETGRFRIHWHTTNESPAGAGTFKLTLRSAISGRTIGIVADVTGTGAGTADFDDGPRTYDFLVESANVDWAFRVEETSGEWGNASPRSVPGRRPAGAGPPPRVSQRGGVVEAGPKQRCSGEAQPRYF